MSKLSFNFSHAHCPQIDSPFWCWCFNKGVQWSPRKLESLRHWHGRRFQQHDWQCIYSSITRHDAVPYHTLLISTMITRAGGLSIPYPRSTTIPAFMLNLKHSLQYVHGGVWIRFTDPLAPLPRTITDLYRSNWQTTQIKLSLSKFFCQIYWTLCSHLCKWTSRRQNWFLSSQIFNQHTIQRKHDSTPSNLPAQTIMSLWNF